MIGKRRSFGPNGFEHAVELLLFFRIAPTPARTRERVVELNPGLRILELPFDNERLGALDRINDLHVRHIVEPPEDAVIGKEKGAARRERAKCSERRSPPAACGRR